MDRDFYMSVALTLAEEAAEAGEAPVGCVIVRGGEIIARGRNRREERGDALAHAELEAIREACEKTRSWRLHDCALFVTLEPCPMCAGAIINARIEELCFGARDRKGGACGGVMNLFEEGFNHRPRVFGGIMERECGGLLTGFFEALR